MIYAMNSWNRTKVGSVGIIAYNNFIIIIVVVVITDITGKKSKRQKY